MLKVIKHTINLLAVICYIVVGLYVFISAPLVAGYHPVVVLSGSMEPTYPVGGVIYYKQQGFNQINEGDVITFTLGQNNMFVTHRVDQKHEAGQTFVTKGDANKTADRDPVPYNRVKGVVAPYKLPFAGYYVAFINTHLYLIILIAVILLAKIALSYVNVPKKVKEA